MLPCYTIHLQWLSLTYHYPYTSVLPCNTTHLQWLSLTYHYPTPQCSFVIPSIFSGCPSLITTLHLSAPLLYHPSLVAVPHLSLPYTSVPPCYSTHLQWLSLTYHYPTPQCSLVIPPIFSGCPSLITTLHLSAPLLYHPSLVAVPHLSLPYTSVPPCYSTHLQWLSLTYHYPTPQCPLVIPPIFSGSPSLITTLHLSAPLLFHPSSVAVPHLSLPYTSVPPCYSTHLQWLSLTYHYPTPQCPLVIPPIFSGSPSLITTLHLSAPLLFHPSSVALPHLSLPYTSVPPCYSTHLQWLSLTYHYPTPQCPLVIPPIFSGCPSLNTTLHLSAPLLFHPSSVAVPHLSLPYTSVPPCYSTHLQWLSLTYPHLFSNSTFPMLYSFY